jgi:hypothetical protein
MNHMLHGVHFALPIEHAKMCIPGEVSKAFDQTTAL